VEPSFSCARVRVFALREVENEAVHCFGHLPMQSPVLS
jgi:hypothetical protein